MEFALDESFLPFNFFDEIDFSYEEIAIGLIKNKYTNLSNSKGKNVFKENYDLFSDKFYELRNSDLLHEYCIDDYEVNESSGTWGYRKYKIDDINHAKKLLEQETFILLDEVLSDIKI